MVRIALIVDLSIVLAGEQINDTSVAEDRESREEVAIAEGSLGDILMRSTITEEDGTWDVACALPASDLSHCQLRMNSFTVHLLFINVIELHISELLHSSMFTDLCEFLWAIGHLIDRHVGVSFHCLDSGSTSTTHLGEHLLTFSILAESLILSLLLIDGLLAQIVEELCLEGVEEGELVGAQFANLSCGDSVAHLSVFVVCDLEVDTDHVKLGTSFLDEQEQVLALLVLELLGVLENDQLELDDSLELSEVGLADVLVCLVQEFLAVLPRVEVDLIWISPFFNVCAQICALVSSVIYSLLSIIELHGIRPGLERFALPQHHVILEVVAAAPPLLVGIVLGTAVNVEHPDKVLLSIAPGGLDDKLINIGADLLVLRIVGIHNVKSKEDDRCLDGASDGDTYPTGANLYSDVDSPDEGYGRKGVEEDNTASIWLNVIQLGVVLVDRENPRGVIDGHLIHAGAVANEASHAGNEENCNHEPDNDRLNGDGGVIILGISQNQRDSDEDTDAENDVGPVHALVEFVRWE